jgi:hypothetical protein
MIANERTALFVIFDFPVEDCDGQHMVIEQRDNSSSYAALVEQPCAKNSSPKQYFSPGIS